MSYQIIWHPNAAKYLESLPNNIAQRILGKFNEVSLDPFRYLEHFEDSGYKLRIGDYRAVIDIEFDNKILKVRMFDKRGRVYN